MIRKFTNEQKLVISNYYIKRKSKFSEQTKQECLDKISCSLHKNSQIISFVACAGTFWFQWKDGITTIHNERNWWKMKKYIMGKF